MEKKKIVIIGGVATGASAAARLRRLDEHAEIIMFEKSGYISFANCGLPYHISGVIEERDDLLLQTPESFYDRFQIHARVNSEVTNIDRANKIVTVLDHQTQTSYDESYDTLIIATGSEPFVPPIEGIKNPGVFTLRNVEDMDRIISYMNQKNVKRAIVVGGGAIGLEVAENLVHKNIKTSVIELADHVIAPIDKDIAAQVHTHIIEKGIALHLNTGVTAISSTNESLLVHMGEAQMETDMVILSIGVRPDTKLAKMAGLELTARGHIVVDDTMKTSDEDIYAGGDAVAITDFVSGAQVSIPLAGPANKHGRIIADNICGKHSVYQKTQGTSILQVFDLTIAMTGNNERLLNMQNISYDKLYLFPNSHASYYPGASPITMKIMFEKHTGRLLGAQMVGTEGVDKRMDVFATAMRANLTIADLKDLELTYSPIYSSAKDPLNMAGFLGENVMNGVVKQFYFEDIPALLEQGAMLVDTRTKEEYENGHIPGAKHMEVDQLRENLAQLDMSKAVYIYCQVGVRGYIASRILRQHGIDSYNLAGGYQLYEHNN